MKLPKCAIAIPVLIILVVTYVGNVLARPNPQNKIHPVILVHGMNSDAGKWETRGEGLTIYHYLINDGYDLLYVTTFGYVQNQRLGDSDDDLNDVPTDTDQDISNVAAYLASEIDYLYNISGGVKVDVVAHSLGGIVTREYLREHPNNHRMGKFIDVATPHSGSSYLEFYDSLPKEWQKGVTRAIDELERYFYNFVPNPNSISARQLVPNSAFMQRLNSSHSPADVQYWMLYGDIQLQVKVELFWFDVLTQPLLAGDLVVSRDNAATIPNLGSLGGNNPPNYHTVGFQSPTNLQLVANILPGEIDWDVRIDGPLDGYKPYWHNGLLRNPEVNQKILSILNDGYVTQGYTGTPAVFPAATSAQINSINTSTVMVLDTSSSMDELDSSGVMKIEAARDAGYRLLDVIGAENQAGLASRNEVAVVRFNTYAVVDLDLTSDIDSVKSVIDSIYPGGATAMPKGLRTALDLFPSNPVDQSFIILLSDGLPNIGLNDEQDELIAREQVINLSLEAGQRGICIYTIGFGDPNSASIDEDLLRQVAENSGCGSYHNAQNAWELANIYVNLRHASTGTTLLDESGSISQDELVEIADVQVPDNQSMILFTLNWPGSQLSPVLLDPNGLLVDQNYPGASFDLTETLASVIIQNPPPGLWNVSARGVNVPEGVTTWNALLSVRPNLNPPTAAVVVAEPPAIEPSGGFPIAIAAIVLAAVGMTVYVVIQTQKRSSNRAGLRSSAFLIGSAGGFTGRTIPISDGMVIGRSPACALRLPDSSISRRHARIRYAAGKWFIQDVGSLSGIYINGVKVRAAELKRGDQVRFGPFEFEFRS
jgi:Mg-chelatase subunit ChlD/pimeloyl-ACP methyl ester carboxylesterase